MLGNVAFLHTTDERFLALCEIELSSEGDHLARFTVTPFDHENTFLKLVATSSLDKETIVDIIAAVLLAVAQPVFPHRWLQIDHNDLALLGLLIESSPDLDAAHPPAGQPCRGATHARNAGIEQLPAFLMHAPTPFVMLQGPDHRVTFINPPYIRLTGRDDEKSLLNKPIREALPELEGQPFFGLLDQVFTTGTPFVGIEVPAKLRKEATGEMQDCFFDFIYHPVRNDAGQVSGIMVQANEVTERVLSRQVTDSREHQLYSQWQEIDVLYRTLPAGVALVSTRDLNILRINERFAALLQSAVSDLEGTSFETAICTMPTLRALMKKVCAGETVRDAVIEDPIPSLGAAHPSWRVNITPFSFSPSPEPEKACVIFEEISA